MSALAILRVNDSLRRLPTSTATLCGLGILLGMMREFCRSNLAGKAHATGQSHRPKDIFVMGFGDSGYRAGVQKANRLGLPSLKLNETGLEAL